MNAPTESLTRLQGKWLLVAQLAWVIGLIVLAAMHVLGFLAVHALLSTVCEDAHCTLQRQVRHTAAGDQVIGWAGPPIGYADRLRPGQVKALETLHLTLDQYGWLGALQMGIPIIVYLLIAAGLFWRKRGDWMVLFISLMIALFPLLDIPLPYTLVVRQPAWEGVFVPANFLAISSFLIFPLIFPTGRFVPRWTRWVVLFDLAFGILVNIVFRNAILEVPGVSRFIPVYIVLSFGIGVYGQFYRFFRVASPVERQQLKWVIVGMAGYIIIGIALLRLDGLLAARTAGMDPARAMILSAIPDTLFRIASLFIPVSIAISVLRYRLWEIDLIISRTLVYGTLSASIIMLYIVLVGALSVLLQTAGNILISLLATGLIAVLFQPLRERLQRGVNHFLYGDRDDPYAAFSRLGRRLEASLPPAAVLPTVVNTVREVLKLPYASIYIKDENGEDKIVAESASPSLRVVDGRIHVPGMGREGLCIPLVHQGETLGYLVLGPRAPNEAFHANDLRLLNDLAPQVGVAVHAVRLTVDLQRSREQMVLAREEERRRLRRDLHDGLGPQLAAFALKLETLRNRLKGDPLADSLLVDLATRTQDATADIRRLVYALRPPTLDEFGLLLALRESVAQYTQPGGSGVEITFDGPESLPPLPAAVEVAVYRITQEALMNVIRHADAHTCTIHLSLEESAGQLCLEIQDDGKGIPIQRRAGVGLNSMRERAEELGGTLTVTTNPTGGTCLLARLPGRMDDRKTSEVS